MGSSSSASLLPLRDFDLQGEKAALVRRAVSTHYLCKADTKKNEGDNTNTTWR